MSLVFDYLKRLMATLSRGWNVFWFTAVDPATLCAIRIPAGLMLFYTHLIWSLDLLGFFGAEGRLSPAFNRQYHDRFDSGWHFAWSHFNWIESSSALWCIHILALVVFFCLAIGLFSRVVSILALLITLSYVHRAAGALFGLDQINVILAMYLALGPCGARYSVDSFLRRTRSGGKVSPSVSANIAIRLLQLHVCVIYLFAGLGKLQGASWWEGTAMWLALANYEYQSIDMTWIGKYPLFINAMTHLTLAWEVSYVALIWPKLTRPLVLAFAIPIHLGIAFCMGMITFGVIMLVANLAFVSPDLIRSMIGPGGSTIDKKE